MHDGTPRDTTSHRMPLDHLARLPNTLSASVPYRGVRKPLIGRQFPRPRSVLCCYPAAGPKRFPRGRWQSNLKWRERGSYARRREYTCSSPGSSIGGRTEFFGTFGASVTLCDLLVNMLLLLVGPAPSHVEIVENIVCLEGSTINFSRVICCQFWCFEEKVRRERLSVLTL